MALIHIYAVTAPFILNYTLRAGYLRSNVEMSVSLMPYVRPSSCVPLPDPIYPLSRHFWGFIDFQFTMYVRDMKRYLPK